jgi:hypothetical protein
VLQRKTKAAVVACSSAECRAHSFGFDSLSVLLISSFCLPPHQFFLNVLRAVDYEVQGSHHGKDAPKVLHVINFNTGIADLSVNVLAAEYCAA